MNEPSAVSASVPLAGAGDQDRGQRVAVGVGVVAEDAGAAGTVRAVSSATV